MPKNKLSSGTLPMQIKVLHQQLVSYVHSERAKKDLIVARLLCRSFLATLNSALTILPTTIFLLIIGGYAFVAESDIAQALEFIQKHPHEAAVNTLSLYGLVVLLTWCLRVVIESARGEFHVEIQLQAKPVQKAAS